MVIFTLRFLFSLLDVLPSILGVHLMEAHFMRHVHVVISLHEQLSIAGQFWLLVKRMQRTLRRMQRTLRRMQTRLRTRPRLITLQGLIWRGPALTCRSLIATSCAPAPERLQLLDMLLARKCQLLCGVAWKERFAG